jgi:hypothetical protein
VQIVGVSDLRYQAEFHHDFRAYPRYLLASQIEVG